MEVKRESGKATAARRYCEDDETLFISESLDNFIWEDKGVK
ncbi:hypothetical protein CLCAR_3244 [Clostridium carboxidivorans P7]|nr:hypothetical protein CLCAR_3244 [Clostridium carboxidivorans P7]